MFRDVLKPGTPGVNFSELGIQSAAPMHLLKNAPIAACRLSVTQLKFPPGRRVLCIEKVCYCQLPAYCRVTSDLLDLRASGSFSAANNNNSAFPLSYCKSCYRFRLWRVSAYSGRLEWFFAVLHIVGDWGGASPLCFLCFSLVIL